MSPFFYSEHKESVNINPQDINHGLTPVYEINIPHWHPAKINKLLGHWRRAHRIKKSDRQLIAHYCRHIPKATKKRIVEFTIFLEKGQRAGDPDAYFKSLLDGLVHAGMLVDDNRQWVEIHQPEFVRSGEIATLITLRDA